MVGRQLAFMIASIIAARQLFSIGPAMAHSVRALGTSSSLTRQEGASSSTVRTLGSEISVWWFEEVTSTMDTAKEIIRTLDKVDRGKMFAVVSDRQTKGRGTRGRAWQFGQGNVLMSVCIPQVLLPLSLQYLPLRSGTLIANAIRPFLTAPESMTLKWPNDILIDGKKVCGVLIEMEDTHLVIGIGCNVMSAPEVPTGGAEHGRPSTAIVHHSDQLRSLSDDGNVCSDKAESCDAMNVHHKIAVDIVTQFGNWVDSAYDNGRAVVRDFSEHMDFSEQRLRDRVDQLDGRVEPIGLNDDGTLRVRYVHDGSEVDLVAEYLF